jgi:hypothetical protein
MALALAHIPVSSETNLKVSSSRIESLEFGGEFRREEFALIRLLTRPQKLGS